MGLFRIVVTVFGAFVRDRSQLMIENLALRQRLACLPPNSKSPRVRRGGGCFWGCVPRVGVPGFGYSVKGP